MGLFGRRRVLPATPLAGGPVPAKPAERVAAVNTELLADGIGGAAAQGRPLTADGDLARVVALVEHYLPDTQERRALCRQMAADLHSMLVIDAVDVDEIHDVLGATSARLGEHQVPRRAWATCRALADTAIGLARDVGLGEGEDVDRWQLDDGYVLETLAVLVVIFTRLSV